MHRWALATLVATAGLATQGCAADSPNAPTSVEVLSQTYLLVCGGWSPARPPTTRTLVDVRVQGTGDKVTASELEFLRQQGGEVIHEFAAGRLVRVAADVDRLLLLHNRTLLTDGDFVAYATTVTNPAAFKVVMIVSLDHPVTDGDLAAARALGGTIRHIYTSALVGYSLEIEDGMVTRLRGLPGVVRANLSGYGCLI